MRWYLVLAAVSILAAAPAVGQTVEHVEAMSLEAGIAQARVGAERSGARSVWIGYSIPVRMYGSSHVGWWYREGAPALADVLRGQPDMSAMAEQVLAAVKNADRLVTKELAILLEFLPDERVWNDVRVATLDAPANLEDAHLFWLGVQDAASSLSLLMGLVNTVRASEREKAAFAVGMHQEPEATVPFLLDLARTTEIEDVREAALHGVARALTDAMNLYPDVRGEGGVDDRVRRSAMHALVNANEGAAPERLLRLASARHSRETRREAIMQLSYLDDGRGLSALESLARSLNLDTSRK